MSRATTDQPPQLRPLIFAGGSAMKGLLVRIAAACREVRVVLPVTDDGSSSGRIVARLGGPAVGDLRQVICHLGEGRGAPPDVIRLLKHRLSVNEAAARAEWAEVVAGRHRVLAEVADGAVRKWTLDFVRLFDLHIRHASATPFAFSNGSLGNFVLSGARLCYGNVDAGLVLISHVLGLPLTHVVLPATTVEGRARLGIGLLLRDGGVVLGQNQISHPHTQAFTVDKTNQTPLPGRPERLFFVREGGDEAVPRANSALLFHLRSVRAGLPSAANVVVYGRGSFFTSVLPGLLFDEVTRLLLQLPVPKVWIVNGTPDREASYVGAGGVPHFMSPAELLGTWLAMAGVPEAGCAAYVSDVVVPLVAEETEEEGAYGGAAHVLELAQRFPSVRVSAVRAAKHAAAGQAPLDVRYDDNALMEELVRISNDGQRRVSLSSSSLPLPPSSKL